MGSPFLTYHYLRCHTFTEMNSQKAENRGASFEKLLCLRRYLINRKATHLSGFLYCRDRRPRRSALLNALQAAITYINDAIRHAITYTCGDYILLRRYKVSPTDRIKFSPSVSHTLDSSLVRGSQGVILSF